MAVVLIPLAISAAITAGETGLQYLIAKKQKANPIDRGKQDDIRLSIAGYGEPIIKGWGKFRCAPVWIWHSPIVHTTITTPGHSGGKGAPKPPSPDTIDHVYTTSLAGVFHDGIIYGGVERIWFDTDLVYVSSDFSTNSQASAALSVDTYESEFGVLAGGAAVVAEAACSFGRKVTCGNGKTITINVDVPS